MEPSNSRTPIQVAAVLVGATFLLVGVLGFVPGVTQDLADIEFAGHSDGDSGAQLLGIFHVSVLHNLVHVLFGVAGLVAARSVRGGRGFLVIGGAVYLALFAYGMLIDRGSDANFVPVDMADNWLHAGLGTAMVALGLVLADRGRLVGRERPRPLRAQPQH